MYAVSIDSPFVQQAFSKENELSYPLLGDPNRTAAEAFSVLLPELAGIWNVSDRAVFVFTPGHGLVYRWHKDETGQPPIDRILAALSA